MARLLSDGHPVTWQDPAIRRARAPRPTVAALGKFHWG